MVMTALGVSVRRLSAWRMTGIAESLKLDNMVVEMVNLVVDRVK
ncbi:hypothetical protein GZL_01681 [Streptomyces sp. 769]|nr:hypothetical protein GZL_01681 [Streptomyces sp. 769]